MRLPSISGLWDLPRPTLNWARSFAKALPSLFLPDSDGLFSAPRRLRFWSVCTRRAAIFRYFGEFAPGPRSWIFFVFSKPVL